MKPLLLPQEIPGTVRAQETHRASLTAQSIFDIAERFHGALLLVPSPTSGTCRSGLRRARWLREGPVKARAQE